jgi:glycosyltransferase involved in cell wall biosynthesis
MTPNFFSLCQTLLDLNPSDWASTWENSLRPQITVLESAHSAQLNPAERNLLETATRRLLLDPADGPAQVCLLLLRRDYQGADSSALPKSCQTWCEAFRQENALLTLLPAVQNKHVTILLPTYNRISHLQMAVQSILAQSHTDWTLIIADDGSNDGTAGYLQILAATESRIRVICQPQNQGLYATMELLYQACETELVMSLADDDYLMPTCLATTLALFERYPWISMAGGGYYYLHFQGSQLHLKQYGPYYDAPCVADNQCELQRAGIINPIFGGGALFRKAQLLALSAADPEAGDNQHSAWDWFLTAEFLGRYEVGYSPEIAVAYIDHKKGEQFTHGRNWGQPFLYLLERLIRRYEDLYGAQTFPVAIIQYFMAAVAEPYLVQAFQQTLARFQTSGEMDAFITSQRSAWELHCQIRQTWLSTPADTPALITPETVAGRFQGDIPGMNQGQTPPALQNLLNTLLR